MYSSAMVVPIWPPHKYWIQSTQDLAALMLSYAWEEERAKNNDETKGDGNEQ
jgi:hypothetical protein